MEDQAIIELYLERNEDAIRKSEDKYGRLCHLVAKNILNIAEDAEECVNETWLKVWNSIPPQIPDSLKAFLCKITRNLALSKYREKHAAKRYNGLDVMLDELEECVPSDFNVEATVESAQLGSLINIWLGNLGKDDRVLFVKRYYFGESVKELAKEYGYNEQKLIWKMSILRKKLRVLLESQWSD